MAQIQYKGKDNVDQRGPMDDFTWHCKMEKKKFHSLYLLGGYLSTFLVKSIVKSLILVLLTFLKKKMFNTRINLVVYLGYFLLFSLDVNFSYKMMFF